MTQQYGIQTFDEAQKLFKESFAADNVQALAEKTVATSKEFYDKTATFAQGGAKALTEIADTAWGSTKLLNEKFAKNVFANVEAGFAAAREMASAKSFPEIAKIQADFMTKFAAQATEQTKEFADLSTRAAQHIFEKAQTAAKGLKPIV